MQLPLAGVVLGVFAGLYMNLRWVALLGILAWISPFLATTIANYFTNNEPWMGPTVHFLTALFAYPFAVTMLIAACFRSAVSEDETR